MNQDQDPALTPARLAAFDAVQVQLVGVTHGLTGYVKGIPHVEGGSADDFDRLMTAANKLSAERGDRLAIEPTGFKSAWDEKLTLASILPADIPDAPVGEMPQELREEIVAFLERGRHELYLNNLAYVAAHTLLRGVPVHRAEVSLGDWEALQNLLPELGPLDAQVESGLFYRNTKMIARLGDIAIDMEASMVDQTSHTTGNTDPIKPTLLFASGSTHTLRLAERFMGNVSFTANV